MRFLPEDSFSLMAYCLLPNHFHLLIRQNKDVSVSKFILKVATSYSMYFNKKYNRSGGLFESRFKSKHVDSDEYLKYLFSYIHLNPVKLIDESWKENNITDKENARRFLEDYRYSSYSDYLGSKRMESVILNKEEFPEYFAANKDFNFFINEWLLFRSDN